MWSCLDSYTETHHHSLCLLAILLCKGVEMVCEGVKGVEMVCKGSKGVKCEGVWEMLYRKTSQEQLQKRKVKTSTY